MKPFLKLKQAGEVLDMIFRLPPLTGETIKLENAWGRRLAAPFYAPESLPGFARSSMDGYAVRASDVFGASESSPALLQDIGVCHVGKMPEMELKEGECAAIFTGAPLPKGADAVVMVEHSRAAGKGHVELIRSVAPGANIVEADEDASQGQQILAQGALLRAPEIGILAAFGQMEPYVVKKPRVAIISTGDEIVPIDAFPGCGKLRDVNSWSLAALCMAKEALPFRMGIVRDEPGQLLAMLGAAKEKADVIVVSGGSSAGMRDHTIEAFQALPDSRVLVHGVAISPGKPFIFAMSGEVCLLGLPGHVTSALVCAHVFLAPLLARLQGLEKPDPEAFIDAVMGRSVASAQGRRDYIRCRLEKKDGNYTVWPLLAPSAVLAGLLEADGYVICPENSEGLAKGQAVRLYPFSSF